MSRNSFKELIPAIYHLEAKIISRGAGRSVVAASAYMSCSRIENDYDGITHDYTKKGGLVYENVFLPIHAPPEWSDRAVLWNAVEEAEKSKDSRLAREFILALPFELPREIQISEAEAFAKLLTDDGMCVDVCIHDTNNGNPHAHIMATVRPLTEKGTWQNKTQKEYLCIRDGEVKGFTASEFLSAQNNGWEKQYQYYVGEEKVYLPPSQADGYERVNKYPKSSLYGRQNPVTERWNSETQLIEWRRLWAEIVNKDLNEQNISPIDYRSNKARGITEQSTIHEGVSGKAIRKKGKQSERSFINSLIREDNKLLKSLRNTVKMLTEKIKTSVSAVAEALETLRINMISLEYKKETAADERYAAEYQVKHHTKYLYRYNEAAHKITTLETQLSAARKKHKRTPKILKEAYAETAKSVRDLELELEDLYNDRNRALYELNTSDDEIETAEKQIEEQKKHIPVFKAEEQRLSDEIDSTLVTYTEIKNSAESVNADELSAEQMRIRPKKETTAREKLNSNETESTKCRFNNAVDVISEKIGEEPPHFLTEFEQYRQDEYERWLKQEERRKQEIRERYKPKPKSNNKNHNRDAR